MTPRPDPLSAAPARFALLLAVASLFLPAVATASGRLSGSFVNFESGQVRPLALSPDRAGSSRPTRQTTTSRSSPVSYTHLTLPTKA